MKILKGMYDFIFAVWIIASILAISILATSCKTQTVVVPQVRTEYVHDTIQRVDSVWKDRWHTQIVKGDTVYIHDSITDYKYKTMEKIVEVCKTDSVPYPVEVVREVKTVPPFYKNCTILFWLIVVAVVLYVAWRVVKAIYLRR